MILAGAGLGMVYSGAYVLWRLDHRLDASSQALEMKIEGEVASIPRRSGRLTRIEFKPHRAPTAAATPSSDIPARLYYGIVRLNCYNCVHEFEPGQIWRLHVRLRGIHGLGNPGLFDYEQWAFQKRLVASGTIKNSDANRMLSPSPRHPLSPGLRGDLDEFLVHTLGDTVAGGIVRAITLGVRHGIGPNDWEMFRGTGTGHLVAISGLHISLVFGCVFLLANVLTRVFPAVLNRFAAQRLAAVMALPPTIYYAWIAGLGLPTQRAVIMLGVFYLAYLLGRRIMGWHTVLLALGVLLVIDPLVPLAAGSWLSFGAVAAIVGYLQLRQVMSPLPGGDNGATGSARIAERIRTVLHGWVGIQVAISLVVLPMSALFFGHVSLVSPLVNLLAIPYFSVAVLPASLFGVFSYLLGLHDVSRWLLHLAGSAAELLHRSLSLVAELEFSSMDVSSVEVARFIIACAAVVGLCRRFRRIPLTACCLAALLSIVDRAPLPPGAFRLSVLDVAQGLSAVVETSSHALVFDTGVRYGSGYDLGEIVVNPYLLRQGIKRLNAVVVSHGDNDHAGGLSAILRDHPDAWLIASETDGESGSPSPCIAGLRWRWDDVSFEFLSPVTISERRHNNRSCVLRIRSKHGQALLTGDIEADAERALVRRHGDGLESDILVVPHHGSGTSSTRSFLKAADPAIAIISRGLSNPYSHPHPDVLERLERSGARLLDTALDGAVVSTIGEGGIDVTTWREASRPPWRSLPSRPFDAE